MSKHLKSIKPHKYTKADLIGILHYSMNKDRDVETQGQKSYTNLSKAKINDIKKLLQRNGVNEYDYEKYWCEIETKKLICEALEKEQKKMIEEDRLAYNIRKNFIDENNFQEFNNLSKFIKNIVMKQVEWLNYIHKLKHYNDKQKFFEKLKKDVPLTFIDENGEINCRGVIILYDDMSEGIDVDKPYENNFIKELIEDLKKIKTRKTKKIKQEIIFVIEN